MSYYADSHASDRISPGLRKSPQSAAEKIVANCGEIAVLPHVVFKVMELSGSTENAASEIERVITVDPGFSARVLALANSSYYALGRKVTSIRDAIVYLGFKNLRDMALTAGVFDMFVGKNDKESLRRRGWWRTSVDAAVVCRLIAENTPGMDPAEAYTCGLLHYIGKNLLDRFGGHDYTAVEQRMNMGATELSAETRVYGCDHVEIGTLAGKKWELPEVVVASLSYAEKPQKPDPHNSYKACVALGNFIAKMAVAGNVCSDMLPDWAMEELGIPLEKKEELYQESVEKIAAVTGMQF